MKERVSQVWPEWTIEDCIGKGGFGNVYEITREVFGDVERCALKVISIPKDFGEIEYMKCEGMDDESISTTLHSQVGEIIEEYKLMMRMRENPNIVHCEDFRYKQHPDDLGWDIFIKMELLTPLTKALDRMKEEKEILRLGIELCNALAACQKHNIIHRDIKPQNIFLSQEGYYKLGDFGIARTMEHTTKATAGIGTYSFMAPEVALGQSYGSTVDIYSLGLVLYWLLNERRGPFVPLPPAVPNFAENDRARMRRYSGEKIPEPRNGSGELKAIVLKAIEFSPKDRFQSAQEMMDALKSIQTLLTEKPQVQGPTDENNPESNFEKTVIGTATHQKEIVSVDTADDDKTVLEGSETTRKKLTDEVGGATLHGLDCEPKQSASEKQAEPAQETWICPECETKNTGKVCELCRYQMSQQSSEGLKTNTLTDFSEKKTEDPQRILENKRKLNDNWGVFEDQRKKDRTQKKLKLVGALIIGITICAMCLFALSNKPAHVGWVTDGVETYYYNEDGVMCVGWETIKGERYYFNSEGVMETGWRKIGGELYFFNQDGTLKTDDEYNSELQLDANHNILMENGYADGTVLGKPIARENVLTITFLDTLKDAPTDAWDVSANQDKQVLAWTEDNGQFYDLYIAGEGGVQAPKNCMGLFRGYSNVKGIYFNDCFDTSNVTFMGWMFAECSSLESIDVSKFDTSNVTTMNGMFYGCGSLSNIEVGGFETSNVTNMSQMFHLCDKITCLDIEQWDLSAVEQYDYFTFHDEINGRPWREYFKTETNDFQTTEWKDNLLKSDNVTAWKGGETFESSYALNTEIRRKEVSSVTFLDTLKNVPAKTWDVSSFQDGSVLAWAIKNGEMYDLYIAGEGGINARFACQDFFNSYINLESIEFNNCFHTEETTNMSGMFANCNKLKYLDISMLDTSKVTDMSHMFMRCEALEKINIGLFNTSNVASMSYMFAGCSSLETIDVSGFDTSKVTMMNGMFDQCFSLSDIDVSGFDTSKVKNMYGMFFFCGKLTSLDVENWDLSALEQYDYFMEPNAKINGRRWQDYFGK